MIALYAPGLAKEWSSQAFYWHILKEEREARWGYQRRRGRCVLSKRRGPQFNKVSATPACRAAFPVPCYSTIFRHAGDKHNKVRYRTS